MDNPAPAIPILKPKINIGSKIVLITAPDKLHIIVYLGLPSALIKCPPPVAKIKNGKPIEIYLVYVLA